MAEAAYEGWAILESWRPVVEFEGIYEVSDIARVRRVDSGLILARRVGWYGYPTVQLWRGNKSHTRLVHVLVAVAFLGPCPPGMEVNHKDGDKTNGVPGNLEYVTRSDNMKHAYRTGLRQPVSGPNRKRKPRMNVPCACGCGVEIETPDRKGRPRRFISGHNMMGGT